MEGRLVRGGTGSCARSLSLLGAVAIYLVALSACGGDDGAVPVDPAPPQVRLGTFHDAVVSGLSFASGGEAGLTDTMGQFFYERATIVTFTVGDILYGQGLGAFMMTPVDLVAGAISESHSGVINRVRFLMSIDDDADATNGIQLTAAVRATAAGKSVNFDQTTNAFGADSNVSQVVADLTGATTAGQRPLVSAVQAEIHMQMTLITLLAGSYGGEYFALPAGGQTLQAGGTRLGFLSFVIDTDGGIAGVLTPTGGTPLTLVGVASTNGSIELTAADASRFFGVIRVDDEALRVNDGEWFIGSDQAGTFTAEKEF